MAKKSHIKTHNPELQNTLERWWGIPESPGTRSPTSFSGAAQEKRLPKFGGKVPSNPEFYPVKLMRVRIEKNYKHAKCDRPHYSHNTVRPHLPINC